MMLRIAQGGLAGLIALMLTACGGAEQPGAAAGQMPPPEVLVETVAPRRIEVINELPGRVQARRSAEVRARVEGILEKRIFNEGSEVQAGATLFQIDPAQLKASLAAAVAAEASAVADARQAMLKASRFQKLGGSKAVSRQEVDEAIAAGAQAEARIAEARAALTRARLDLEYASVKAPISGRIGRALVTEGALVGRDATHLATIEQLDPLYINFTQSSSELLRLRKQFGFGTAEGRADPAVTVLLEDGTAYAQPGKLLFSEMTVDPGTGEVLLRAEVPNPERTLLPGMFVRVKLTQGVLSDALTVPQAALVRSAGGAMVMSVGSDGLVVPLPVVTGAAVGDRWVVESGLKGGEKVVVEGLMKIRPGAPAKPVEAGAASAPATAATKE